MSIYVQIPAYRDRELAATLIDLYAKAAQRERLRVRVLWQHTSADVLEPAVRRLPNLEIHAVPYERSHGCNWARALLQDQWRGEQYTLLLDSHHRFARGWDDTLVAMHEELVARGVERPLVTAYLPPYDPAREPRARRRKPTKVYPFGREEGLLTRLTSHPIPFWRSLERPVPADFVSLHFLFVAGAFNAEIRFDPHIYFFGDEVALGLRAFTWGYDLFHPHAVIGWHAYDRRTRTPHWDDHADWRAQHRQSLDRLRALFLGERAGEDGLGGRRTVADYEERIMTRLVEAR